MTTTSMSLLFIYLTFLLVIGFNGKQEFPKDGEVLVLNDENFEKARQTYKNLFVMFYVPWCRRSQAMFKDFDETAKKLADEASLIKLAKADVANSMLQRIYEIYSYPTLLYFTGGSTLKYTGNRDAESMITYVKSHASS